MIAPTCVPMMTNPILNLAFYFFTDLKQINDLRQTLEDVCVAHDLKGSMILSYEGINGMVAGEEANARALIDFFKAHPNFSPMHIKESWSEEIPFSRMQIKIKPEIVTMRVPGVRAADRTGTHLAPKAFQRLIREGGDDVVVIDVRNDFEYKLGTFKGALNPETIIFSQFPDIVRENKEQWKDKKVAMFCTGGIRCEKVSSWMLEEGFEDVYQLEGGVLNYFERVEDAHEDWDGELFVFDQRVGLDTRLQTTGTIMCLKCNRPSDPGVSCVKCGHVHATP